MSAATAPRARCRALALGSRALVAGLALALLTHPAAARDDLTPPPLVPRTSIFSSPERFDVRIAPDGSAASTLARRDDRTFVAEVRALDADAAAWTSGAFAVAAGRDLDACRHRWLRDGAGVLVEDGRNVHLMRMPGGRTAPLVAPAQTGRATIVARGRGDRAHEVLVAIDDRFPGHPDVLHIDTRTGVRTALYENDGTTTAPRADHALHVRGAERDTASGHHVLVRDAPDEPWYELARFTPAVPPGGGALGFDRMGALAIIDPRGSRGPQLGIFRVTGAGASYERFLDDAPGRIDDVLREPRSGAVQAVLVERGRPVWERLGRSLDADFDFLDGVDGGLPRTIRRAEDDDRWVVGFHRADGTQAWYGYDRARAPGFFARGGDTAGDGRIRRARHLFTDRSGAAAPMTTIEITTREERPLTAFISVPRRDPSMTRPAMVLLLHDHPGTLPRWGDDPWHRLLADRGYIVVSVHHRGSSNHGVAHYRGGRHEWTDAVQDDLIDTVGWAVEHLGADPDRVAVVGAGFGGYAALTALAAAPGFFAAAVDIGGALDLRGAAAALPPLDRARLLFMAGRLDQGTLLEERSPITHLDAIRDPLLIVHASGAAHVHIDECLRVVDALEANGVPAALAVLRDARDPLATTAARRATAAALEAFLAARLGGRMEPVGGALTAVQGEIRRGAEHLAAE